MGPHPLWPFGDLHPDTSFFQDLDPDDESLAPPENPDQKHCLSSAGAKDFRRMMEFIFYLFPQGRGSEESWSQPKALFEDFFLVANDSWPSLPMPV